MNPKVFVGVAIAAVLVGVVLVVTSGPALLEGFVPSPQPATVVPVNVNVDDVSTITLNQDGATLEIVISVSNPNPKAAILSLVKYQIYHDDVRVAAGEIGERSGGMVDASDYYTILSNGNVVLRDRIDLVNTGGAPEFWADLTSGDITWFVTGEAFFNLSSMTSGQENIILFEQILE